MSQPSHLTGSLFVTGSITASLGFDGLSNVFSASAQIDHDSTTNFVANEHIDHSSVSITGTGALSGGGTIAASRAIALDTTSATFTNGVVASLPGSLISSSAQITALGYSTTDNELTTEEVQDIAGALVATGGTKTGIAVTYDDASNNMDFVVTFPQQTANDFTNTLKSKLDNIEASATADQTKADINALDITELGTISSGVWQGTAIASAYLDADTAHLSTAQTFTGEKKFATDVTVSGSLIVSSSIGDNPYGIRVLGAISSSGDVIAFQSSDKNLKDNIQPIESPLEKISKISGVSFDWNNKQDLYTGRDIGVIAQEIESVLPEIVQTRESGMKAVRYEKIVALLIEAIKEQQLQIDELKTRL